MISEEEARKIVTNFVGEQCAGVEGGVVILTSETIKKTYGWIFFYNSRKYVETGNPLEALGGNGPIVVETNGRVHQLGTAHAPSTIVAQFEKEHGFR